MADPVSVGGIDWNQVITVTGGILGTALGALAIRMGWKRGGSEISSPSETVELKSAIVDSSSVKILAASIEGLSFTLLELKKFTTDTNEESFKLTEKLIDSLDTHTQEIRELSREIREHARELSRQPRI